MPSINRIADALSDVVTCHRVTLAVRGYDLQKINLISSGKGKHLAPHEAVALLLSSAVPDRAKGTTSALVRDFLTLGTAMPKAQRPQYEIVAGEAGKAIVTAPHLAAAVEAMVAWAPAWSVLSWVYLAAAIPGWNELDEDQRAAHVSRYFMQPRIELRRDRAGIYARFCPLPTVAHPSAELPGLPWGEAHPRVQADTWAAAPGADWQMCNSIGLVSLLTLHSELYIRRELASEEIEAAELPELRHPAAAGLH